MLGLLVPKLEPVSRKRETFLLVASLVSGIAACAFVIAITILY